MKIILHQPYCLHEIGKRENNEDSIFPSKGSLGQTEPNRIYMVCDGVGGLRKGEVASEIVCKVISGFLKTKEVITESDINDAIYLAEQSIDEHINHNIDALGMATTLTLLVTHDAGIILAHIGDSRIYHLRGGEILHKTFDHSFVNELVSKNIITAQEAVNHPKRNVVTKAISGGGEHEHPDITHIEDVQPGDYFFLCSDGITESISDEMLAKILNTHKWSNGQKIEMIQKRCTDHSKDNHSAYLLQVQAVQKNFSLLDNQKVLLGGALGLLTFVLGIFMVNSGGGNMNDTLEIEDEKIQKSIGILDSLNVDDMDDTILVLDVEDEEVDSTILSVDISTLPTPTTNLPTGPLDTISETNNTTQKDTVPEHDIIDTIQSETIPLIEIKDSTSQDSSQIKQSNN